MRQRFVRMVTVGAAQCTRRRRSLLGWAVAITAVCGVYVGFWPVFDEQLLTEFSEAMPSGLADAIWSSEIATPRGWLMSTVFGLLGPALLAVFAISSSVNAMAGDEQRGQLAFELCQPVPRSDVALGRLGAVVVQVAALCVVIALVTMATARLVDMPVPATAIASGAAALGVFSMAWVGLGWAFGAVTGRVGLSKGLAAAVATSAYIAHVLGTALGRSWVADLSPYHWYLESAPLHGGVAPRLWLIAVVVLAGAGLVGVLLFDRRDVSG